MAVRRILVAPDLDLALGPQPEGVEVGIGASPLDPSPFEPHEVLLVSADPEVLAEAGRLGIQRLVVDDDLAGVSDAIAELVDLLERS